MSKRQAIIIAARRTVIGRAGGVHARRRIEGLAAPVLRAVLMDAGLSPEAVNEVVMGNAAGGGGNPARLIALAAGLPETVPALSIDSQCASGLDAIAYGARMIEAGGADAVIAGGAESPSTAPWRVAKPFTLYGDAPRFFTQPAFVPEAMGDPGMIEAAENLAQADGIEREDQDRFAIECHKRAVAAREAGVLSPEIVALGDGARETLDEGPRASLTMGLLARMPSLAAQGGTVTAGNSCRINDGAGAVLIVSDGLHAALGSPPGLVFEGAASAGVEPRVLGLAGAQAALRLRGMAGFAFDGLSAIELNDAFAAQALATAKRLDIAPERINALGGALAFGHPYGASGALLVLRLFTQLIRLNDRKTPKSGLAVIAGAGGVGTAAIFRTTWS